MRRCRSKPSRTAEQRRRRQRRGRRRRFSSLQRCYRDPSSSLGIQSNVVALGRRDIAVREQPSIYLGTQHVAAQHALPRILHHGDPSWELAFAQREACGRRACRWQRQSASMAEESAGGRAAACTACAPTSNTAPDVTCTRAPCRASVGRLQLAASRRHCWCASDWPPAASEHPPCMCGWQPPQSCTVRN